MADPAHAPLPIHVTRLPGNEDIPLPARQSEGAAGYDLHAAVREPVTIAPGGFTMVPTGLSMAIPPGFEGQVRPRSGLAARHGIGMLNAPGTIDSDYRGEVKIILFNFGAEPFCIRRGERIAQIVIARVQAAEWLESGPLDETERGSGGFGHTGR